MHSFGLAYVVGIGGVQPIYSRQIVRWPMKFLSSDFFFNDDLMITVYGRNNRRL
jgi:hypothetical protein